MADSALMKKLRLQADQAVAILNAPDGYLDRVTPLPDGARLVEPTRHACDYVQLFVTDSAELAEYGPGALDAVKPGGILWICYPKVSSGFETDLTRDAGWKLVYDRGLRGVASAYIDDTWSAIRFRPVEHATGAEAIDAQYAGDKAELRPIFEAIDAAVFDFGDDVERQVRKAYVAYARGKQFAAVQPSTRTRVDVGLKLPDAPASDRLVAAPGKVGGGSMTHKVSLYGVDDVNNDLVAWLRQAYEGVG